MDNRLISAGIVCGQTFDNAQTLIEPSQFIPYFSPERNWNLHGCCAAGHRCHSRSPLSFQAFFAPGGSAPRLLPAPVAVRSLNIAQIKIVEDVEMNRNAAKNIVAYLELQIVQTQRAAFRLPSSAIHPR